MFIELPYFTDTNTTMESANLGGSGTVLLGDEVPSSQFTPENVHLDLESLPVAFPSDQIRTIQNINTLIAEVSSFTWNVSCLFASSSPSLSVEG